MQSDMSFDEFFKKRWNSTVVYCRDTYKISHQDSEDIAQEAFTELWNKWDTLNSHMEFVLLRWIRTTTRYIVYHHNRKKGKEPTIVPLEDWLLLEELGELAPLYSPELTKDADAYEKYIQWIRSELTPKQWMIFESIVLHENEISTTAKLLNMRVNTVSVYWLRIKNKIKKEILPNISSEL